MKAQILYEPKKKFKKSSFKSLSKWNLMQHKKYKHILCLRIGILKDGRVIIPALAYKNSKITGEEKDNIEREIMNFAMNVLENTKKQIIIDFNPDNWVLKDLPTKFRNAYLKTMVSQKEEISYIG